MVGVAVGSGVGVRVAVGLAVGVLVLVQCGGRTVGLESQATSVGQKVDWAFSGTLAAASHSRISRSRIFFCGGLF
jgi:hypothetical protein